MLRGVVRDGLGGWWFVVVSYLGWLVGWLICLVGREEMEEETMGRKRKDGIIGYA